MLSRIVDRKHNYLDCFVAVTIFQFAQNIHSLCVSWIDVLETNIENCQVEKGGIELLKCLVLCRCCFSNVPLALERFNDLASPYLIIIYNHAAPLSHHSDILP